VIFIDTGALLGRYLARDQHHREAMEGWEKLRKSPPRIFTSNFVLDETITFLARRAGHEFAAAKARSLLTSGLLDILRPEAADEQEAIGWLEKLADQGVSFTDCVSFTLMRKARLKRVFGFDRHFRAAGFELWP
jgi:predicted nucleic acid-binding protein